MSRQRAADLWESLRQNLIDSELLLDDPQPETDKRQIEMIDAVINPPADRVGLAKPDSARIDLVKDKDTAGHPRVKATSATFGDAYLPVGRAMVIQFKEGSISIESRKVTW
jgi:hypothetical protein